MSTPLRHRFVRVQIVWLLGVVLALTIADAFSFTLFALLGVIGFITITELLTPADVPTRWRDDLDVVVTVALVVAVVAVNARLVQLFAPDVLP